MKQEDKELLFQDLCCRLPYGVNIYFEKTNTIVPLVSISQSPMFPLNDIEILLNKTYDLEWCKPYLRPMSSMTEEEKEELKSKCLHTETEEDWDGVRCDVWCIQILDKYDTRRWDNPIWPSIINMDAIDWLNAHYFDYRDLIPKGLALEMPKDMYPIY